MVNWYYLFITKYLYIYKVYKAFLKIKSQEQQETENKVKKIKENLLTNNLIWFNNFNNNRIEIKHELLPCTKKVKRKLTSSELQNTQEIEEIRTNELQPDTYRAP